MTRPLAIAAVAFASAVVLTPLAMVVARWTGTVDRPGPLKPHASPVPYLGGVAVFLAAVVGGAVGHPAVLAPLAGALVLGVLDRILGHYQLSAPAGISIGPGEVAQPLHPDDAIYPVPRPHPELVVNVMWPLQDFTEENGATRIVAGSHRWTDERPDASTLTVSVEMPAGTALVYSGQVWHGGGANRTDESRLGVVLHYGASWLRPVENHVLAVPPAQARELPVRLQELLGYNVRPPFLGYVDGRHPSALLERQPVS